MFVLLNPVIPGGGGGEKSELIGVGAMPVLVLLVVVLD
jgi:hypothetical protein